MMGSAGSGKLGATVEMKTYKRVNEISFPTKEAAQKIADRISDEKWETVIGEDEDGFYIVWARERISHINPSL